MDQELRLEHCLLRWQIENFDFWGCGYCRLSTPYFQLDDMSLTKWKLSLMPNMNNRKEILKFRLHRSEDDEGRSEVSVNLRLVLFVLKNSDEYTVWPTGHFQRQICTFEYTFKRNSEFTIKTLPLNKLLGNMNTCGSRPLIVVLNMFVLCEEDIYEEKDYEFPPTEAEYMQLSLDLRKLYFSEHKWDFDFHAANGIINAHRAVIAIRAPGFNRKYLISTRRMFVKDIPAEALRILILHMYTGDYKLDAEEAAYFPFLRQYAHEWNVHPLKDMFTPNEIIVHSEIDCELCDFEWTIRNYSDYEKYSKEIKSPVFTTGHTHKEDWFILLFPNNKEDCESVTIEIHVANINRKVWVYIGFGLIQQQDDDLGLEAQFLQVGSKTDWLDSSTVLIQHSLKKKYIKKALHKDGRLCVCCTIKVSNAVEYQTFMEVSTSFAETPNPEGNSYRVLSEDFQNYSVAERLADLKLTCSGLKVDVHKIILGARSTFFHGLFKDRKFPKVYADAGCVPMLPFQVPELGEDPCVIKNLLIYIYSGRVVNSTPSETIRLALVADRTQIWNLYECCSTYLQRNLEPDSVGEVLALATSVEDSDLRYAAFSYIRKHSQIVFATEEWRKFENNWKALAQQARECAMLESFED